LRLLERRTARSGKDFVDHGRGGSDDHANCVCGVLALLAGRKKYDANYEGWSDVDVSGLMPGVPMLGRMRYINWG
jgi:hypothetical protein